MKPLPMIYGEDVGGHKLLYLEKVENGYYIAVVNVRGSHPCGYIMVPHTEINRLINGYPNTDYYDYDMWYAEVHGGFTYVAYNPYFTDIKGLWLGWDYAHLNDYTNPVPPSYFRLHREPRDNEHVWTTEEIIEEAKHVIKTLEFYNREEE